MSQFLQIASRVEAAVAAYTSVHDSINNTERRQWRDMFQMEFVSVYLHTIESLYGHLK
jgi:hypothetical protein